MSVMVKPHEPMSTVTLLTYGRTSQPRDDILHHDAVLFANQGL